MAIKSDLKLFTSKANQIIHELKEARTVQKILRFNIDRLDEIEKRYVKKVDDLEKEIDKYMIVPVNKKDL